MNLKQFSIQIILFINLFINFQTSISGLPVKNHFQSPEKVEMLINQLANRAQILNNQNLIITIKITQDRQNTSCIIL